MHTQSEVFGTFGLLGPLLGLTLVRAYDAHDVSKVVV